MSEAQSLPVLQLADLSVRRGGRTTVISRVDCVVEQGEWLGIIGANGSGKTSLLRAIAGRLSIAGGSCKIAGEELTDDRAARAQRIGYAPPIERLPSRMSAAQALEFAGSSVEAQEQRNAGIWHALGLRSLLSKSVGAMSSGMRQRLSIGIAFAHAAPLVILDEPFNWLDPVAAFDLKQALAGRVGPELTLITALHDTATLCAYCRSGILLGEGQIKLHLDHAQLRAGQSDPNEFERRMIAALR